MLGLPLLHEAAELRQARRCSRPTYRRRGPPGSPVFMPAAFSAGTIVPFTTVDSVVSPSTATVLSFSVPSFCMSLMRIAADPSGRLPGVTIMPRRRLVDDRLREVERHQHALLLVRDARLRVTGEVDERAEHGEHVVVLRERGAQPEDAGRAERGVVLEVGNDLRPVDPAVLVDVVDVDLVDLLLLRRRPDQVGVLPDRREVDERDAHLDGLRGDARPVRLVLRCVDHRCRRRGRGGLARPARTARRQRQSGDHDTRDRCATLDALHGCAPLGLAWPVMHEAMPPQHLTAEIETSGAATRSRRSGFPRRPEYPDCRCNEPA